MNYTVEFYDEDGGCVFVATVESLADALLTAAAMYDGIKFWHATCYYKGNVMWEMEIKLHQVG